MMSYDETDCWFVLEWDLGGFPAWLLAIDPSLKLRSSDPTFLQLVSFIYLFRRVDFLCNQIFALLFLVLLE